MEYIIGIVGGLMFYGFIEEYQHAQPFGVKLGWGGVWVLGVTLVSVIALNVYLIMQLT